jgi:hypothetical protein
MTEVRTVGGASTGRRHKGAYGMLGMFYILGEEVLRMNPGLCMLSQYH